MRRTIVLSAALLTASFARAAHADETDTRAQGTALFDEGRKLMEAKDYEHACPKLAAADKLIQGIGTAVNLGECYEQSGKLASAVIHYQAANGRARKAGEKAKEQDTEERVKRLEPRVPHLVIDVPPEARAPGLEVKKQGSVIVPDAWGTPFPCDQGHFDVDVSAPGKKPRRLSLDVVEEGKTVHLAVPALEDDEGAPPDDTPKPKPEPKDATKPSSASPGRGQRIAGFVIGGTGIAAGIAGFVVGGVAYGSQVDGCKANENGLYCPPALISAQQDAHSLAWASTGLLIGAGALVGAGIVVLLTAPSGGAEGAPKPVAQVRVTPAGLALEGSFR
ncbi:MAG: hypothetical protein U0414_41290 [Polyangiaceae bacterium]